MSEVLPISLYSNIHHIIISRRNVSRVFRWINPWINELKTALVSALSATVLRRTCPIALRADHCATLSYTQQSEMCTSHLISSQHHLCNARSLFISLVRYDTSPHTGDCVSQTTSLSHSLTLPPASFV
jgi:hypothetical protein